MTLAFLVTAFLVCLAPGIGVVYTMSMTLGGGWRAGAFAVIGCTLATVVHLAAAMAGLAAVLHTSALLFQAIKWAGVAYLVWLGVGMIRRARAADPGLAQARSRASLKALWLQGFLTSAANPKAVVFFAALFPQFITAEAAFWPQLMILSATYIVIDGCFLSAYGGSAGWIAARFKGPARLWIERVGGGFMIGAAVLLGLKTIGQR